MSQKSLVVAVLLAASGVVPVYAEDFGKFAFNIGGGVSTPLNPTAQYVGISGNFTTGAGYNIDKHNSIIGEFMWAGLPPNVTSIHPVNAPFGKVNLYSLTTNYRYKLDNIGGSIFGVYAIAGGGWYYRNIAIDKNYVIGDNVPCQPVYTWWGYSCAPNNYVYTATIASKGVSAGGVNAGAGFTIRLTDSGLKFYVESRYHYAFSNIPSTLVPVTFGFRFN
jgi:hypothetical protein